MVQVILCMLSGLAGALMGAFFSGRIIAYAQSLNSQSWSGTRRPARC